MRIRLRQSFYLAAAVAIVLIVSLGQSATATEHPESITDVSNHVGSITTIRGWQIQSSTNASESGQAISRPSYSTKDWYPVNAPVTVFAGLLENGKYPHTLTGSNLRAVNDNHYAIPWWYRTEFRLHGDAPHTFIKFRGIIPNADIFVNGTEIANHDKIAGAFTVHTLNITLLVRNGVNVLAIRVYPANAERNLAPGWIDWNPAPPDNNMGIWRDVDILRSGPVSLHGARVTSKVALPGLKHADLTVKVDARNDDDNVHDAIVAGHVAGLVIHQTIHLPPHQTHTMIFSPGTNRGLRLLNPRLWWPVGMGKHPLYHLSLSARVGGAISDRADTTFGIRDVSSYLTKQGYRQFVINGESLLIRGAGWAPDIFLRDRPKRLREEFQYVRNLGINAIRTEGKLERQKFYDLADRNGIMILPGWECCDKWEAWAGTGGEPWDAADRQIAGESMASEARRLRNHPSVIAFLIGSDNAPPARIAKIYTSALHGADWPNPIVSAASDQKSAPAGSSGLKMTGPYAWVPPDYWYTDKYGGAFGFNSETSAGIDIPRLETLKKMLTPTALEALWSDPKTKQFHAAPLWSPFSSLKIFDTALTHRYGKPRNLTDYVKKAELANYEATRAQFEAYSAHMDASNPATGVVYWMLNNAWPSLHWHLFNYALNPAGAYFGAKKANEPVHIQYSYDNHTIMAVNHTRRPAQNLKARIRVHDIDGKLRYDKQLARVNVPANHTANLLTVPQLGKLSNTYFLELVLSGPSGQTVSRNVYWLSARPDRINWNKSTWYYAPVTRFANLNGLNRLSDASVHMNATTRRHGETETTAVTLSNPSRSGTVAFFQHLSIHKGRNNKPVLPITWNDNDVTLWPGEAMTLSAHYAANDLNGDTPVVQLSGWNVAQRRIPAPIP